jgi:transposase-like protein
MSPKCPRCASTGTYPMPGSKTAVGQRWEDAECRKHFFVANTRLRQTSESGS